MDTTTFTSIILAVIIAIYFYLKRCYTYWERKGLHYLEPEFLFGNTKKVIKREISIGQQILEIYREIKRRGWRHAGIYMFFRPVYIPADLEIVKCIMQKDFEHFLDHGSFINEKADPLSGHLFNLEGAKWKNLRVKLTPTFTSGKMKQMFQTLLECSDELQSVLKNQYNKKEPVDIKDVVSRFTTDIIGSCAFGLDCNSMKDPNAEFRKYGKKVFEPSFIKTVKGIIIQLIPRGILKKTGFKVNSSDTEAFFIKAVGDTIAFREQNNIVRNDFLQLMIRLKNNEKLEDDINQEDLSKQKTQPGLTLNEIAAQCFVFFLGGFETSSTTTTFALAELALNQNVQDKLRQEIYDVLKRHNNKVTYDSIIEMDYLEKVINETLRKYPPLPVIPHICTKDYTVPGTDVTIEKDTTVQIPVIGFHRDPEYYPNPDVFDPERFSEENKAKRPAYTFIPFGEGPRICIGLRFGKMQTKLGLITILRNYRVTLNEKTKTPITLDPKTFLLSIDGGLWLDLQEIK